MQKPIMQKYKDELEEVEKAIEGVKDMEALENLSFYSRNNKYRECCQRRRRNKKNRISPFTFQ